MSLKLNNIPLPNLPLWQKVLFSAGLLVGILTFTDTWYIVLHSVYWEHQESLLGIGLAVLAAEDEDRFSLLLTLHGASMAVMLLFAYVLLRKIALRRKIKKLLAVLATVFAALDISAWLYAPDCTSSNLYVGLVGFIAAAPLLILAMVPLWQMWIYRRWRSSDGKVKRVVIIGGGFAGLYAALGLNRKLGYNHELEITVLDRRNYFLFPPLLPSAAAGTIETRQVSYPFRRIFETTNIRFRKVDVTRVDPAAKTVHGIVEINADPMTGEPVLKGAEFPYDYLVLAPGSLTQTFNTPGAEQYALFMRELNDAVLLRNQVIDCFERAAVLDDREEQSELLRFVIVGAGPTGIETATEIYDLIHEVLLKRYPEIDRETPEVVIIQSGKQILPGWHDGIVRMAAKQLARMNIKVLLGGRVSRVTARAVFVGESTEIKSRTIVWCAGVRPSDLLGRCNLEMHSSGRVVVQPDLRVGACPEVFVLGDAAYLVDERSGQPLPPLGQVAFQQGSHTAKNIVRLLAGFPARPFRYFDFGGLVSVGEHYAAVNLMGVRLSGFIGWVVWRTLYLTKLVGMSNRIRVLIDWTLDLLIERSISQIRDPRAIAVPVRHSEAQPHQHGEAA